ncbi:MAG: acetylornithine deacetylase, partial [Acidobacteria bacterium]|nr:acetylornithine deacetylase [Acidobacteriota bacterium]
AATDSRRFTGMCPAVYRFAPLRMTAQDRASIHGLNERVSIAALAEGVQFYREFLQRLNTL